jgi:hypothetical protein
MRYGFVGLGQMGYPMALNLLRKTSPQSTLTIFDVNPLSLSRFVNHAASIQNAPKVSVAKTPRELAENSVGSLSSTLIVGLYYYDATGIRTRVSSIRAP